MSDELARGVREAIAGLAASDRTHQRFGAAAHRYELAPPLSIDEVAVIERVLGRSLPDDLRMFATTIGSGGAGPYYGWIPLARAARSLVEAPPRITAWTRALPIAHLGCGYAAVLPLDGSADGELWIDARAAGVVRPIAPSFTALYLAWIDRLAHGSLPDGHVAPDACALAAALSGYLGVVEAQRGIERGTLAGEPLREALAALPAGAIQIAADASPALFAPDEPVDPCIVCARTLENLAHDGLRRDVVAPGLPPLPLR